MCLTLTAPLLSLPVCRWLEDWNELDSAATVHRLSLPGAGLYVYEAGSGVQETTRGLWDVFRRLLHDALPQHRLLLRKAVSNVQWMGHGPGSLTGAAGAAAAAGINNNVEEECLHQVVKPSPQSEVASSRVVSAGQSDRRQESSSSSSSSLSSNRGESSSGYQNSSSQNAGGSFTEQGGVNSIAQSSSSSPSSSSPPEFLSQSLNAQSDYRVAVNCEDGDVVFADHVIVTSSVGFLKERCDFFVPPLPKAHVEAIGSAGFGNVAKVFLLWDPEDGEDPEAQAPQEAPGASREEAGAEWRRRLLGAEDVEGVVPLWPDDGSRPALASARSSLRTSVSRLLTTSCLPWYVM